LRRGCGTWAGAGGGGCGPTDAAGVGAGWTRDAVREGPERESCDPEVHRVCAARQDPFHNLGVLQPGGDTFDASLRMPGDTGKRAWAMCGAADFVILSGRRGMGFGSGAGGRGGGC
jgi:hypothetical protein